MPDKELFARMTRVLTSGHRVFFYDPCSRVYPVPLGAARLPHLNLSLDFFAPGDLLLTTELLRSEVEQSLKQGSVQIVNALGSFQVGAWNHHFSEQLSRLCEARRTRPAECKAAFLDRDGVIIEPVSFLRDPALVHLREGVVDFLRRLRSADCKLFLITNQSGLGRGQISWREFDQVQSRLMGLLASEGIWFDQVEWASYIDESKDQFCLKNPELRKPEIGMLDRLIQKFGVDPKTSLLVGDRTTDLEAGRRSGVGRLILIQSEETPPGDLKSALATEVVDSFSQLKV